MDTVSLRVRKVNYATGHITASPLGFDLDSGNAQIWQHYPSKLLGVNLNTFLETVINLIVETVTIRSNQV